METNRDLHQALWLWLHYNPEINGVLTKKTDWPRWDFNGGDIKSFNTLCFACREVYDACINCPITWSGTECLRVNCQDTGTLFTRWAFASKPVYRSELAKQIALLPWKGEK
jgi:hypothetical protein